MNFGPVAIRLRSVDMIVCVCSAERKDWGRDEKEEEEEEEEEEEDVDDVVEDEDEGNSSGFVIQRFMMICRQRSPFLIVLLRRERTASTATSIISNIKVELELLPTTASVLNPKPVFSNVDVTAKDSSQVPSFGVKVCKFEFDGMRSLFEIPSKWCSRARLIVSTHRYLSAHVAAEDLASSHAAISSLRGSRSSGGIS